MTAHIHEGELHRRGWITSAVTSAQAQHLYHFVESVSTWRSDEKHVHVEERQSRKHTHAQQRNYLKCEGSREVARALQANTSMVELNLCVRVRLQAGLELHGVSRG